MNTSSNAAGSRWVLGFDSSCFTCADIAKRIQTETYDSLEVRSLRSPEMAEWRSTSLPKTAPWLPTLFHIRDGRVRAWQGVAMSLRWAKILGPVRAFKLGQIVGQTAVDPDFANNPGRRQVLKALVGSGMAGGLIAMGKTPVLASVAGLDKSDPRSAAVTDAVGDRWRVEQASRDTIAKLSTRWNEAVVPNVESSIKSHGVESLTDVNFITVYRNDDVVRNVAFQTYGASSEEWATFLSFERTGRVLELSADFRDAENPSLYAFAEDGSLLQVTPNDVASEDEPQPTAFPDPCDPCWGACNIIVYNYTIGQVVSCSAACTAASGGIGIFVCVGVCAVLGAFAASTLDRLGCSRACSPVC